VEGYDKPFLYVFVSIPFEDLLRYSEVLHTSTQVLLCCTCYRLPLKPGGNDGEGDNRMRNTKLYQRMNQYAGHIGHVSRTKLNVSQLARSGSPSDPELADEGVLKNDEGSETPLTTIQTAQLASIFCFLWFIANWSVNASLKYTSVGSSTVLASTSGM
jgi:hypothetical protein